MPSLLAAGQRVRAAKAERSLIEFIRQAWHIVEPSRPFVDGWHIHAVCEHLEAVSRGEITNLIINVPPGHMKSLTVCVFWPTWDWIRNPHLRWLFASYASTLSIRDSVKMRDLIESPWFAERWGDRLALTKRLEWHLGNNRTGFRLASSTGGVGTGERVHRAVNDDLLRANDAHSQAMRKQAVEHLQAMSTRGVGPGEFAQVLIMQRLHEHDPAGWLLSEQPGEWEHLCLPAEFDPSRRVTTSIGWTDPRTEAGELLWPAQYPREEIERIKRALGSYKASGQLQQQPAPEGGGIFNLDWFGRYKTPPASFSLIWQSWDTAFKKGEANDYSVCTTWGMAGNAIYLLDVWRKRAEFPELKRAVTSLAAKWKPSAVLVEDKASGQSLLQELRNGTSIPLLPIQPDGDKVARAYAVTPTIEAGRVFLPESAPWLMDYETELALFPNAANDDSVDSTTQGLNWIRSRSQSYGVIRG